MLRQDKKETWQDIAKRITKAHEEKIRQYGGEWSMRDTADSLNISLGAVSEYVNLGRALRVHYELEKMGRKEATKWIRDRNNGG
jgi:DNA-directed RNA polymerase specialized sigma24 family protein